MKNLTSCVLTLVLASACGMDAEPRAPGRAPRPPVVAPSAPDHAPLPERLSRELAARPDRAVHAERLEALLELRGVHIVRSRQVLASPLGARYCATLVSERGLGASLCEFASDDSAAQGMALSERRFARLLPGRRLLRNGNSLLTLAAAQGEA